MHGPAVLLHAARINLPVHARVNHISGIRLAVHAAVRLSDASVYYRIPGISPMHCCHVLTRPFTCCRIAVNTPICCARIRLLARRIRMLLMFALP
ncbi:hypothetical protein AVEN_103709-1 [Araneus ventricosus]|uniref:Uncharacterized protein n=1 Tax=Araneus ventricosus TaxID=182803 RepID=A0A4Y2V4Y1_ARAVE|nr:hypothetical protein AVEN_103709-1 [Araneus ventricosus]